MQGGIGDGMGSPQCVLWWGLPGPCGERNGGQGTDGCSQRQLGHAGLLGIPERLDLLAHGG